ncbi:MAG: GTP-binding protein [Fuerstiella sp.]|nr:GTP-binding protein [Fuerstiella sp.]
MNGETKVTRLTAAGRGAVAVMRANMSGRATAERLDSYFRAANGLLPSRAAIGRILYGLWDGEDVVVVRVSDNNWEIHCHGGDAAVKRISQQLTDDVTSADPPPHERPDNATEGRLEKSILKQLLKCRTPRTASFLLTQYTGALRQFLTTLSGQENMQAAAAEVNKFLRWRDFAAHLTAPWRVAVIGQPNAGKSSLLNAIIGYERSIVFDQPGTTRDLVEAELILDGWPLVIVDTAGIRTDVSNDIEAVGVDSARRTVTSCDACLLVVDSQRGWTDADEELLSAIPATCQSAILWNKTDLPDRRSVSLCRVTKGTSIIETSAVDGIGINEVLTWLPAALVSVTPLATESLPVIGSLNTELTDFVDSPSQMLLRKILAGWL